MHVVDPWHWLTEQGDLPQAPAQLRASALKVARLIEYGAPLAVGVSRETLVECTKRPRRKPCPGLLHVKKELDEAIHAHCGTCGQDETLIHNWKKTQWADTSLALVDEEAPGELSVQQRRRFRRPYPAARDQVRITRQGETALIEYAEPDVSSTQIKFGPELAGMSDGEVLDWHNAMLERSAEHAAAYHHVAIEIPPGRPQLRHVPNSDQQWVPRGGVLRCLIEDGGPYGEAVLHIDDQPLSAHDFGKVLTAWAGWGIRILLVPEDELTENPDVEVREPATDDP